MTSPIPARAWEGFARRLDGTLVLPDSPDFEYVRRPRIERFEASPRPRS